MSQAILSWGSAVLVVATFLMPLLAEPTTNVQKKKQAPSKFIRIVKDDDGPTALQTAIVRYRSASREGELVVDLIGVVHIGERAYYRRLNKQFEQYDALLYELVAPQGTRPVKGKRGDNPLHMVQKMMSQFLDLDSQLEYIDYSKKNMVHADLSAEEMAEAVKKRGDTGVTLALSIAADFLRQQNLREPDHKKQAADLDLPDLNSLFTDALAPAKVKRLMAQQFESLDHPGFGIPATLNTILVGDRNQAALKVLQKEIAKGRKKIGIFYGAAHMPDFEKRLRDDFDLIPVHTTWLEAWDLRLRERPIEELLVRWLLESLRDAGK